ncbi:MAG: hypothetical protein NZL93_06210, partial [Chthoniobacterales bacterium]|nr:hypothetical protein [Chthoniobacterales bacterium]
LRMTYFLFAALTFASFFIFHNFFENKDILRSLQESVRPIFMGAISCFLALLPWMVVLYQSNQTPIFPLFLGTANPEFIQLGHKAGKIFDYFRAFAFFLSPEALVLLFFGILLPFARNRALCISAYAFSIIVSWLICVAFGVSIFSEYYRYTFPVLCSVAFWLAIQALNSSENLSEYPKVSIPAYFFTLTLIFLIGFHLQNGARELVAQVESLPFQYANTQPLLNSALTGSLKYLQKQTPVGSKIYAAVDAPYGFDFKRNDVQLADVPGGARIGEWPLKQGPEALRRYLLTQGFQFIMAVEFEKAMLLYTRKHWLEHQRPEWFFKEVWGKYFLDFMDSVDALAKDNRLIQTAGNVRLIDLRDKP